MPCISSIAFWELDVVFFSSRNNQTVSVACVNLTNCNQKLLITFGDDQMPLFCELSTRLVYSSPGFSEEIDDSDNWVVISEQLIAVMVKPEKSHDYCVDLNIDIFVALAVSLDLEIC